MPDPTILTTDETIARIIRYDQYYSLFDMIYARDLLSFDFEYDAHYHPPTNIDALDANFASELEQHTLEPHMITTITDIFNLIKTLPLHAISQMRLDQSLCPLHGCDYQSCFDDDDGECAQIRATFPQHDT